MVVKDAVIFSPGATIAYALSGGSIEYNTIASVDSSTQITVSSQIGSGGIDDGTAVYQVEGVDDLTDGYRLAAAVSSGATSISLSVVPGKVVPGTFAAINAGGTGCELIPVASVSGTIINFRSGYATTLSHASGSFVLFTEGSVPVEWFGFSEIFTDIGATINRAYARTKNLGIEIVLPVGVYPVATAISLQSDDRAQLVNVRGRGTHNTGGVYPWFTTWKRGTVLDGSSFSDSVIFNVNMAAAKTAVHLRDFYILGNSAQAGQTGLSVTSNIKGTMSNLYVTNCGGKGIVLSDCYGCNVDGLMANLNGDTGIEMNGLNANQFSFLVSRENGGDYAVAFQGGWGNNFGELYIESNQKGAFTWNSSVLGNNFGNFYVENNNTAGTADYEFRLGDNATAAGSARNCVIGTMYLNEANTAFGSARIGLENADGVSLGFYHVITEKVFEFSGSGAPCRPVSFVNCYSLNSTIDLSGGIASDSGAILFVNCGGLPAAITLPDTIRVDVVGGDRRWRPLINNAHLTASGTLKACQTFVTVNATSGAVTVTVPDLNSNPSGREQEITIIKTDGTGNAVTVAGNVHGFFLGNFNLTTQGQVARIRHDSNLSTWHRLQ